MHCRDPMRSSLPASLIDIYAPRGAMALSHELMTLSKQSFPTLSLDTVNSC